MFDWGKLLTITLVSLCCVVLMSVFSAESQAKKSYQYFNRFDNTYHYGTDYRKGAVSQNYNSNNNCHRNRKHFKNKHKHNNNRYSNNGNKGNTYRNVNSYYPNSGYYYSAYPGGYVVNYTPSGYFYGGTIVPSRSTTVRYSPNPYFNRSRPNPYFSR